ncbi:multicomponent Na+:H+ antiporter subunit G [Devosia sp. YR412]|uniref:monovalent cation/H(+) antiporter subunit G n=1 Tax=Devosia sp. YR412 TaxID=1881030 RepID=UPI0008BF9A8A|nr:monovalent cation/H(+) antiporter subunit G [Devosia sp. YR412]SEP77711.1 multicomponent Na+:H+ antiporter subunit G [Devosia sp. YR412]
MITDLLVYTGCVVLVLGAAFTLIASIGVVRLPDLYTRMHAASKAGAVGGGLVLLAVALTCFDAGVALRAVVGIVFLLLTTPVGAHLLARANHHITDQKLNDGSITQLKSRNRRNPQR